MGNQIEHPKKTTSKTAIAECPVYFLSLREFICLQSANNFIENKKNASHCARSSVESLRATMISLLKCLLFVMTIRKKTLLFSYQIHAASFMAHADHEEYFIH